MGDFIGSGSHGEVYKAMEIHTGRIIAVKKMMCIGSLLNEDIGVTISPLGVKQINIFAFCCNRRSYRYYRSFSMRISFNTLVMRYLAIIYTSIWSMSLVVIETLTY